MEQNPYEAPTAATGRQSSVVQRHQIPGCFYVFGILLAALLVVGTILGMFFPE